MKKQQPVSDYRQRRIQKRRKKRIRRIKTFLKLAALLVALYLIIFHTPLFEIKSVQTVGNSHVKDKEILMASDIKAGQNLVKINYKNSVKEIEKIPYIKEAKIKYEFFGKIKLQVKESENAFAVKSGKKFIYIDEDLTVLEIADKKGDLPVVEGYDVKKNKIGSKITIDESQKFDIILIYRKILIEKNIYKDVEKFYYDLSGIIFETKDGVKVKCGTSKNAEYKIAAYIECKKAQPQLSVGTFDVTNPSQIIYTTN